MRRTIVAFLFSLTMLGSVLGPSVAHVLDLHQSEIVLLDHTEEDSKKEIEQTMEDEKEVLRSAFSLALLSNGNDISELVHYLEHRSNYTTKINLPPPEFFA